MRILCLGSSYYQCEIAIGIALLRETSSSSLRYQQIPIKGNLRSSLNKTSEAFQGRLKECWQDTQQSTSGRFCTSTRFMSRGLPSVPFQGSSYYSRKIYINATSWPNRREHIVLKYKLCACLSLDWKPPNRSWFECPFVGKSGEQIVAMCGINDPHLLHQALQWSICWHALFLLVDQEATSFLSSDIPRPPVSGTKFSSHKAKFVKQYVWEMLMIKAAQVTRRHL